MNEQKQDDQLEPTYSSSVPIRDVVLKTNRKQWTIGRSSKRESEISVLIVRHDDDDDDFYTFSEYAGFFLGGSFLFFVDSSSST